ncbi:HIT family protein [Azotobacter chroococcum]
MPEERWIAETENAFAFRDKNPQAPVHVLVVPKSGFPLFSKHRTLSLVRCWGL